MSDSTAPAGWYPDPGRPGYVRLWDGQQWTDVQLLEGMQPVEPSPVSRIMAGLGALGGVLLLLPVLAFFLLLIWLVLF